MGCSGQTQTSRLWARSVLAAAVVATFAMIVVLALPSAVRADVFDDALAQIDAALQTNPNGVSPDSIRSCRAMRKTAILLRKMGHHARAVRRLKSCRKLLGFDEYRSQAPRDPRLPWPA